MGSDSASAGPRLSFKEEPNAASAVVAELQREAPLRQGGCRFRAMEEGRART
jgi:hypothetical protein